MIVHFTEESGAALWLMLCNPAQHWKTEDWYRPTDVPGELQVARLHKFVLDKLSQAFKEDGQDKRKFIAGPQSLRKDLVERVLDCVEHYRKLSLEGKGGLQAIHLAELQAACKGEALPTADDAEDPEDAAELARLRGASESTDEAKTEDDGADATAETETDVA
jgi:hypothetical protein